MSLSDYTSPFFGDRDLGPFEPPPADTATLMPNRNRANTRVTNDAGQVVSADIFINTTAHALFSQNKSAKTGTFQSQDEMFQGTLVGESDKPACILAVPATYGNMQYTEMGQIHDFYRSFVANFNDIPTFYYFLISRNRGASFTFNWSNTHEVSGVEKRYYGCSVINITDIANCNTSDILPEDVSLRDDTPRITYLSYPNDQEITSFVPRGEMIAGANSLRNWLISINSNTGSGCRWYGYNQEIICIPQDVISKVEIGLNGWQAIEGNHLTECRYLDLNRFTGGTGATNKYIGAFIATGLPIFTVNSFDQMVSYLEGGEWLADNDPPPPSDWSTDWDIYVNGTQKPDILITMKSDKLDEWLADLEENTSGLSRESIKVEYRYREYELEFPATNGALPKYKNSYTTIEPESIDTYNNDRSTSYGANIVLNYPLVDSIVGGMENGEFSSYNIEGLYPYHAELGFRIVYDKYMSAWCYYKIGVIGSPSVPDFSKMKNEGGQDDAFQDNSTVTIHYNEYPAGYDPYPTPPLPPMPPVDDTSPSASQTGIGLLTTTYKVTAANAAALGRFFWGGTTFEKIKALNTSPIENVVGLNIMPIDISGNPEVIVVGDVVSNINGDRISNVPLYTVGSVQITGRYQSFLDYEPYTSIWLFLPFVGFVQLDPVYVTNKTLKVVYSYDIINGICNAMLFCDDIYVESHQGHCGIEIPLVGSNRAQLEIGLASSLITTAASAGAAIPLATKSAAKVATGINAGGDIVQDIGNFMTGFHSSRQGGYDPTCAWTETRNCFLVIETPNASYTGTYGHDKGRPCNASHTIGTLHGFTVCDANVDVSGIAGATEEEKAMIKEMLTTGFYA